MPSVGTELHQDPGQERPEIVVSDFHGEKAGGDFRDLVMQAYQGAGFQVGYNWPYVGGGITRMYGDPTQGFHTIQCKILGPVFVDEHSVVKLMLTSVHGQEHRISNTLPRRKRRWQRRISWVSSAI